MEQGGAGAPLMDARDSSVPGRAARIRFLLVIDHFGMGGAQRQMVELACGLKRRGHEVEVFVYFPQHAFFRPRLDEHRIVVHEYRKGRGFSAGVLFRLLTLIRSRRIDCVISYLNSANIYTELAAAVSSGWKLIVSERTSHHDDRSALAAFARRMLHAFADRVVANSQYQCAWLRRKFWLKRKVRCIYNGLELGLFAAREPEQGAHAGLSLVAVGRIGPEKNVLALLQALKLLESRGLPLPGVSWAGQRDTSVAGERYCRQIDAFLQSEPRIGSRWRWLGVQTDIPALLRRHDALVLPSLYEGLPNAVCEALAVGMPILVSNVCDHPLLVREGERGFLFDPADPSSIADAIAKLLQLDAGDRLEFSRNARAYAEENLALEKMIGAYEALALDLVHGAQEQ